MKDFVSIRKKTRRPSRPGSSAASRVAILLEDIQAKVQATVEAVTGFDRKIEALRTELSQRIDIAQDTRELRADVRQNSDEIRQLRADVHQNTEDIRQLRADVHQNTEDIRQLRADVHQNTEDIHQLRADVHQNTEDTRQLRGDVRQDAEEIRRMRELLERAADREALLKLESRVQVVERRLGIG